MNWQTLVCTERHSRWFCLQDDHVANHYPNRPTLGGSRTRQHGRVPSLTHPSTANQAIGPATRDLPLLQRGQTQAHEVQVSSRLQLLPRSACSDRLRSRPSNRTKLLPAGNPGQASWLHMLSPQPPRGSCCRTIIPDYSCELYFINSSTRVR